MVICMLSPRGGTIIERRALFLQLAMMMMTTSARGSLRFSRSSEDGRFSDIHSLM